LLIFALYTKNIPDSAELVRSDAAGDRRLRLANSSPDVKALFNSPSYIYNLEEHEDPQTNYVPDYWTPLPPIVCCLTFHSSIFFNSVAFRVLALPIVLGTQMMH
jgi:hypothetical protein